MSGVRRATGAALVLTFAVIVLGAWVRATNSGLSCPDWPTCYGHWLPWPGDIPADAGYSYVQVMLEWVHRLLAGAILGPLVLLIGLFCWRARDANPRLPVYAGALVLLLLVQAGLGGVTVLDRNSPWSVALHLSTALLLFSLLWLILERARPEGPDEGRSLGVMPALAVAVWLAALGTMASAAVVAKSGAALACWSWPHCTDGLIPDFGDPLIRLNLAHRLLAALTALGVGALWLGLRRNRRLRGPAGLALALILAEVALGALVVRLEVAVWIAVLHQALGVLVFALVTLAMWRCLGRPQPREVPLHVRVSRARNAL